MNTPGESDGELLARLRRDYGALLERLETNQRDFHRLARSVYRVQEDERRRLARELHDGLGQNLTALKHHLALLRNALPAGAIEALQRTDVASALCTQTLDETRQLSRLLRPQVLDDLGLAAALRWLVRTLAEPAGLVCTLEAEALPALDGDLQTLAFRIVQESLTNVVKHAHAGQAWIRMRCRAGFLQIEVEDNGQGCQPGVEVSGAGSGVGGMRERVQLYGGRFVLGPREGRGCRVSVAIPLDEAAPPAHD
jgi:signal transduction histidine kinase